MTTLPNSFLVEHCPEVLDLPAAFLVKNEGEDSLIAIHLSEKIHEKLVRQNSLVELLSHKEGLNAFLILTEEISHFHNFVYNALPDRQISRFDLELQAEIDKLLVCSLVFNELFGHTHIIPLTQILFNESLIHGSLTDYALASKIAERFWKHHLKISGKNLIFDQRFRKLMRIFTRKVGNEKRKLLEIETLLAA